tara:strand:- start:879 stop:1136 length:258 start_codon:yes stop_codon:yes gene_type:complete
MIKYINVVLLILILIALYYLNVLENYTDPVTPPAITTSGSNTSASVTTACKKGDVEKQPIHNSVINHCSTNNRLMVGNNIKGCLY